MEKKEKEFFNKIKTIAEEIKKNDNFVVLHHYDADGVSSGAIICKALERENKKFKVKWVKQLYSEDIKEIKGLGKKYLFVDFGSNYLKELKKEFGKNFIVIDHHQASGNSEFHLNPLNFGIDGGKEISAAGLAFLVAKELNEKNSDLSALAVIGACGDMQDSGGQLTGLNARILKEAEKEKIVSVKNDLRLYGRIGRPLAQFLVYSNSPVLPELTANEEACVQFLKNNHIPVKRNEQWLSYDDLGPDYKKKFVSALILHMQNHNVPEWKLQSMIGEVYTLEKEERKTPLRDAKEFATLLNACGRYGEADVGRNVCMGDREKWYQKALGLLQEHRINLRSGIDFVMQRGVEEKENFYFFDAEDKIKESIVGIIAGMLYGSGAIQDNKPIIAFARNEDGGIKVSARGTQDLIRKGLNLGGVLKKVCLELGEKSEGGGHKIAAGCRIDLEEKEIFLQKLDKKIKQSYT